MKSVKSHRRYAAQRPRFGFTLLEVIVVLVVLGLFAAIAIPTYAHVIDQTKWRVHVTRDQTVANRIAAGVRLEPARPYAEIVGDALAETNIGAFSSGLTAQAAEGTPEDSGWSAVTYVETPVDDMANLDNSELWVELASGNIGQYPATADASQIAWTFDNTFVRTATRHDDTRLVICTVNLLTQHSTCGELSAMAATTTTSTTLATTTTSTTTTTTTLPPGPVVASPMAAGGGHSCAITAGASVTCWGRNTYGTLGDGTNTDSNTAVAVLGLANVEAVTAGANHSCAIVAGGTVYCWGRNDYGQLGSYDWSAPGWVGESNTPIPVAGVSGATSISAGYSGTCATITGGTVTCWGSYSTGPSVVGGIAGATAVSVGWLHTCAIVSAGAATCWGGNNSGQLGNGTYSFESTTPVTVTGVSGATSIAAGYRHTCASLDTGEVKCWGRNEYGELGAGPTGFGAKSNVAVTVAGVSGATSVSSSYEHVCAVVTGGAVSCWGYNQHAELGRGTLSFAANAPQDVTGISGATAVAAGQYHSCAYFAAAPQQCWGRGDTGQVGNGSWAGSFLPVVVSG